ncbi:MAG TPA: MBL fold metallo-hydrolase [Bryobacteraceae bacterium]|nr:MBL fold metallo-hydrolase [Bryobacteraceae bacterium]
MNKTPLRHSHVLAAALAACLLAPAAALAQGQQDFSKVVIKTTQLAPNFHTLEGQGGTIGVLSGPDGVFMVDSEFAPLTEKIVAAIKQFSNEPIKFLVNTHVHGDHTGGNANLGKMGVVILARENLRNRLMHPAPAANGTPGVPTPPEGLPVITYNNLVTFHMDGEDVQLIPIPVAHTDGDTMVRFVHDDIIMTGDFYRSIQYPNIDRVNGGSLNGMIDGLGQVIARSGPNTKIIPGHGPMVTRAEVMAHRDMILAIRDRVAKLISEGKTEDEVLAAKPTADYDSRVPNSAETTKRFVTQLYAELKPAK